MHDEAFGWLRDAMDNYLVDAVIAVEADGSRPGPKVPVRVLEFGSRDINGSARDAWPAALCHEGDADWIGVDLVAGPLVDVLGDAVTIDLQPGTWDVVVCTEVLEHLAAWPLLVANAYRHLRDGGWFFVTCAGPGRLEHSAADGLALRFDEWYGNVEPETLDMVLRTSGFARRRVEYVAETADERRPNGTYDTYGWAVK